jgi:hypothetical protein
MGAKNARKIKPMASNRNSRFGVEEAIEVFAVASG